MNRFLSICLLVFSCFSFNGCKKNETKEIIATVRVLDSVTGESLDANVTLTWSPSSFTGYLNVEEKKCSQTNDQGYAFLKFSYSKGSKYSDGYFQVSVKRPGYLTAPGSVYDPMFGKVASISRDTENNITVLLEPYYGFSLNAKNVNCSSPTDSLWIEVPNITVNSSGLSFKRQAYGCADTLFSGPFPYSSMQYWIVSDSSYVDVQVTTKKSGIINSYVESLILIPNNVTPVVIEY